MLAIKLMRIGKKHQPSYRVIIKEKRSKLGGRYVDDAGWLNPRDKSFKLNKERILYWLQNGAQPTDSVRNLLVRAGVVSGPKIAVHKKKKEKG
ncbi:30S ribosomal protein S16 [Candidatus Wolfebacteria bacterium]|nr:30S ribosomal protein S16 [Candidatus Wolfebacteria bacterium]